LRPQQSQLPRSQDGLDPGADPEASVGRVERLLNAAPRQADDQADVAGELVFAPKELKVAQDLSDRLGYTTVRGHSRSRPSGLSSGRRSVSDSDHRRALMLPQELLQMPAERLIVLKAGLPPVRGRKIIFYRERAFTRRVRPPPTVPPRLLRVAAPRQGPTPRGPTSDPLTLDHVVEHLDRAGLEPLPPLGASSEAVEAWVERFLDKAAHPLMEIADGR
jgi:type IV secretion system protein VirD4